MVSSDGTFPALPLHYDMLPGELAKLLFETFAFRCRLVIGKVDRLESSAGVYEFVVASTGRFVKFEDVSRFWRVPLANVLKLGRTGEYFVSENAFEDERGRRDDVDTGCGCLGVASCDDAERKEKAGA